MSVWRIGTFNVNGIRARQDILLSWLSQSNCQVLGIQETKVQDSDFPASVYEELGFQVNYVGQKSFNGIALLSKRKPDELIDTLPGQEYLGARFMAARFGKLWVINSYVPQGRAVDDPAFQSKLKFIKAIGDYIRCHALNRQDLLWLGDINVATQDMDVHDPVKLKGQVGFHPDEQAALSEVMQSCGLKDLFREKNPGVRAYSFWDYRVPNGFKRGLGWRIDHMLATSALLERCESCWIEKELRGLPKPSDHAPVMASFKME